MATRTGRTYDDDSMRMCEAKLFAQKNWGETACVFNGKPDSTVPTYKVGVTELNPETKKPERKWLGVGFDWDRAFVAAGITPPAKPVKKSKVPAPAATTPAAHKVAVAKIKAAHPNKK